MKTLNSENLVKFNINDYVYIQIDAEEWQYLLDTVGPTYIKHCVEPYAAEFNGEIWHKVQLWLCFDLLPLRSDYACMSSCNVMFDKSELHLAQ